MHNLMKISPLRQFQISNEIYAHILQMKNSIGNKNLSNLVKIRGPKKKILPCYLKLT